MLSLTTAGLSVPCMSGSIRDPAWAPAAAAGAAQALPPEVGNLRALRALRLDHNKLSELPDTLGQCSALQVLDLDCNKLGGVPLQLGTLVELTTLSLVGNPLGQEVVPGVSRSVAQVYFNLQEGQAPPDERQLQGDKKKQGVAAGTRALLALLREHLDPEACGQVGGWGERRVGVGRSYCGGLQALGCQ